MEAAVKAFLDLIAWSEGTSTHPLTKNDGYDVIVTGVHGQAVFTDYTKHPFEDGGAVLVRSGPPPLVSAAAGRYQILARFWRIYRAQLGLPDFSPESQDAVALQQIKERRAVAMLEDNDVAGAIKACSNIWASLPGNGYGQGGHTMEALLDRYEIFTTDAQSTEHA
jgi:muramidase (phage lysozyme)